MRIATFVTDGAWAGRALIYEGGVYRIEDDRVVSLAEVRAFDADAGLDWADDETRARHLDLPAGEPEPTLGGPPRSYQSRPITAEQLRIAIYVAVGIVAALAIVLLAPEADKPVAAPLDEPGWERALSLSGSVSVTSEAFTIEGAEQRINWSAVRGVQEGDARVGIRAVPVDPAGVSLVPIAVGETVLQDSGRTEKSSTVRLTPGSYRLEITASNCEWGVSLWDRR